ncbi:hypothetical protein Micbo1qcDRAFT_128348 [Microdochium bolleyi]|uniref:Uncharacterized protein n=1 Tax=Microdochium bolleyi TaxID=196109 RepID=A0A136IKW3_9PEZI|nr:hypothetical protein Micbo1qcDRAFT_128348 [Microdochium bolleyi]
MSYTLLHGRFVIRYKKSPNAGPRPDGDTVIFKPDDKAAVEALHHSGALPDWRTKNKDKIPIRFEAVDALETHYEQWHQEEEGGEKARDEMLHRLGFRNVVSKDDHQIESASADDLPGFLLANGLDIHGRIVGFVFAGSEKAAFARLGEHGDNVTLDEDLVDRSADLLNGPARGINKKTVEERVIWPKLFRRVIKYFNDDKTKLDNTNLNDFGKWLRKTDGGDDDKIQVIEEDGSESLVYLHEIVKASGSSLQLIKWPENLVVEPKRGDS